MTKRILGFGVAAAAALLFAAAPALAAPTTDSAQGAGSIAPGTCLDTFCLFNGREFDFSATDVGFVGTRAIGTYHQSNLVNAGPGVTGNVTCLDVVGNLASIGGFISSAAASSQFVGTPFVVYVADNGPADSGLDLISPLYVFPSGDPGLAALPQGFPNTCPPPVSPDGYFPVTQGNIVVDDESGPVHGPPSIP